MKELQKILEQKRSEGKKEIDGKSAFYLYDTFGFPLELTVELAQEENLTVDEEGFAAAMEEQKQKEWVKVTAKVAKEYFADYKGEGPVLHAISVEKAKAPKDPVISFN